MSFPNDALPARLYSAARREIDDAEESAILERLPNVIEERYRCVDVVKRVHNQHGVERVAGIRDVDVTVAIHSYSGRKIKSRGITRAIKASANTC